MTIGQWWTNCQGNAVFSPRNIPGLILWLDANNPSGNGTQPANGSGLANWVDLSNNGYLASQATGPFQPTFQSNIQNGLPCMLFTAANNQGYTVNSFVCPAQTTIFVVLKQLNAGTSGVFIMEQSGDAGTNPGFFVFGQALPTFINNGSTISTSASGNWIGTTFNYIASKYTGSTLSDYLNSSVIATASKALTNSNITDALNIGYRNRGLGGFWYNGYVGEIIVYNNSISPANFSLVQSYISSKWAI